MEPGRQSLFAEGCQCSGEFVEAARAIEVGLKDFSNDPRLKPTFSADTHPHANCHSLGSKVVCICAQL